jgi:hypothetical protein
MRLALSWDRPGVVYARPLSDREFQATKKRKPGMIRACVRFYLIGQFLREVYMRVVIRTAPLLLALAIGCAESSDSPSKTAPSQSKTAPSPAAANEYVLTVEGMT